MSKAVKLLLIFVYAIGFMATGAAQDQVFGREHRMQHIAPAVLWPLWVPLIVGMAAVNYSLQPFKN